MEPRWSSCLAAVSRNGSKTISSWHTSAGKTTSAARLGSNNHAVNSEFQGNDLGSHGTGSRVPPGTAARGRRMPAGRGSRDWQGHPARLRQRQHRLREAWESHAKAAQESDAYAEPQGEPPGAKSLRSDRS